MYLLSFILPLERLELIEGKEKARQTLYKAIQIHVFFKKIFAGEPEKGKC